jgi:hypothetical protein
MPPHAPNARGGAPFEPLLVLSEAFDRAGAAAE